jgi:beta-phosphoglucomutase-like phosphatase (HAD superfamily)
MFNPQCKVCVSEHRGEIEERYQVGMSARAISKWLAETYDEHISHRSISNHMAKHFNVQEQVREEYIKRKSDNPEERMKKFVEEELDEIAELDSIIRESRELRKLAFERIKEATRARSVEVWGAAWSSASREAVRAMKMKMEKLGTTAKNELVNLLKEMWEDENVEE